MQDRRSETELARLRTGHTRLTHGYLVSRETQPFCDDCLVPLTVRHLLVECPSLVELQEQCLSRYRDEDGIFQMSLILAKRAFSPAHKVCMFVVKAGLLYKLLISF